MLDVPIKSHEFTWPNGRRGNQRIDMRLDRAVCSVSCLDDWKTIACSTLSSCDSDHHLIFLKMGDLVKRRNYFSNFLAMGNETKDCQNIVQQIRSTSVAGCPMLALQKKLQAVIQFFTKSWILTCKNSNILNLIPKINNVSIVSDFWPIGLANVRYKIISKILADRLSSVATRIDSKNSKRFF